MLTNNTVVDYWNLFVKMIILIIIKSIRQYISGKSHTMVSNDCFNGASIRAVQNLLMGSIYRLFFNNSVASQSACIIQFIDVCSSKEEKLSKSIQLLDHACHSQIWHQPLKFQKLASARKVKGRYSVSTDSNCKHLEVKNS